MFGTMRKLNALGFIICALLLSMAFYLQIYQGLEPCPLCVLQRIAILLLSFIFFVGIWYIHTKPLSLRIHSAAIIITAILGAVAAIRQIWLQHLPADQLPASCGPDLGYLFGNFPFFQAMQLVFSGNGECTKVTWEFLNLSMPEWTLIFFLLFLAGGIWQLIKK
jgi:disulfide bond formation protein DsbB